MAKTPWLLPRGPGRDATEPGLVSRDGAHPIKERGEQLGTHDVLKVVEHGGNVKAAGRMSGEPPRTVSGPRAETLDMATSPFRPHSPM